MNATTSGLARLAGNTAVVVAASLAATAAQALPQRTFVASFGLDTNPCSVASPCRSFGVAVAGTASGGEVIVLDSAGYGPVTLGQSVSIIAPAGIYAGVSVSSGDGITVNAVGGKVALRGLTINGIGGNSGISYLAGDQLQIDGCTVSGMNFFGINAIASGGHLLVNDTHVVGNGFSGIEVSGLKAELLRVRVERNNSGGIVANQGATLVLANSAVVQNKAQPGISVLATGASTGVTNAAIESTVVSENESTGVSVSVDNTPGNSANVHIIRSTLSNNTTGNGLAVLSVIDTQKAVVSIYESIVGGNQFDGIFASGQGTVVIASRNTVTGNTGTGLNQAASAALRTTGDNLVDNNGAGPFAGSISAAGVK